MRRGSGSRLGYIFTLIIIIFMFFLLFQHEEHFKMWRCTPSWQWTSFHLKSDLGNDAQNLFELSGSLIPYLDCVHDTKKFQIVFQKIESMCPITMKGQPGASTYVWEKEVISFDSICETPCRTQTHKTLLLILNYCDTFDTMSQDNVTWRFIQTGPKFGIVRETIHDSWMPWPEHSGWSDQSTSLSNDCACACETAASGGRARASSSSSALRTPPPDLDAAAAEWSRQRAVGVGSEQRASLLSSLPPCLSVCLVFPSSWIGTECGTVPSARPSVVSSTVRRAPDFRAPAGCTENPRAYRRGGLPRETCGRPHVGGQHDAFGPGGRQQRRQQDAQAHLGQGEPADGREGQDPEGALPVSKGKSATKKLSLSLCFSRFRSGDFRFLGVLFSISVSVAVPSFERIGETVPSRPPPLTPYNTIWVTRLLATNSYPFIGIVLLPSLASLWNCSSQESPAFQRSCSLYSMNRKGLCSTPVVRTIAWIAVALEL